EPRRPGRRTSHARRAAAAPKLQDPEPLRSDGPASPTAEPRPDETAPRTAASASPPGTSRPILGDFRCPQKRGKPKPQHRRQVRRVGVPRLRHLRDLPFRSDLRRRNVRPLLAGVTVIGSCGFLVGLPSRHCYLASCVFRNRVASAYFALARASSDAIGPKSFSKAP